MKAVPEGLLIVNNSPKRVRVVLEEVVDKCFSKFGSNSIILSKDYAERLVAAASSNTYIETLCRQADSLHRRIKLSYEEVIENALIAFSNKVIKKWRTPYISLACDITEEDFYGKIKGFDIVPWTGKEGVQGHFKFLTIGVINPVKSQKTPIISVPVRLGQNISSLLKRLLVKVRKVLKKKKIIRVLLDRGFYSASIINMFEQLNLPYIILVSKWSLFTCMLESVQNWCMVEHQLVLRENKSKEKINTNIVLVKDYKKFDWVFATNISLSYGKDYVEAYKKRWNIEIEFQVEDEARIKTKSTQLIIRYFYFITSLIINILWED